MATLTDFRSQEGNKEGGWEGRKEGRKECQQQREGATSRPYRKQNNNKNQTLESLVCVISFFPGDWERSGDSASGCDYNGATIRLPCLQ